MNTDAPDHCFAAKMSQPSTRVYYSIQSTVAVSTTSTIREFTLP